MNRFSALTAMACTALLMSCNQGNTNNTKTSETKSMASENPLMSPSTLPYGVPDYSKIKDSDFMPAFEEGMKIKLQEVDSIANNPDAPTFENTLVALEKTGQMLGRVNRVFSVLAGANTNDKLDSVQEEVAPKLSANSDAIYLNQKLFQRIETLYNDRANLNLDPESARLLEVQYQNFVLAGAKLSDEDQQKLKKLNEEEASLSAKFSTTLVAAANAAALIVTDSAALAGLSPAEMEAAANAGKDGEYKINLQNTTQQPDLTSLTNRDTRKTLFDNSWNRAERGDNNDTRAIILRLAAIRAEQAQLMGYQTFADWKLQDQMAKSSDAVQKFLSQLVPAATAKAKDEAGVIQKQIDSQKGGFKLEPWDWNFYAEQVRKKNYDLDESQIKPYLEMWNVLENGVFFAANQLYGLSFKRRDDIPTYNPDMRVYEVFDKDSSAMGLFYCDYFKRDNKSGGAWMDNVVGQSKLLNTKPVIYNVCNFAKPPEGQPALISYDDVTTMFHEFGHALHGFFADQEYPTLSGTNVARDFVEFPSQFNEHWALNPKVLANYAKNYKTGEPMPQELVDKIKKSSTFNQGYALTELLAAASLDMQWHSITAGTDVSDVDKFEAQALKTTKLDLPQVPPRYRSSYFLHIWGNGYAAGYYAYLWTEMLDDDAYSWFEENGGMTRENGQRFRDMILSRGNTIEYDKVFRDFRGSDPNIQPMLEDRGLVK